MRLIVVIVLLLAMVSTMDAQVLTVDTANRSSAVATTGLTAAQPRSLLSYRLLLIRAGARHDVL